MPRRTDRIALSRYSGTVLTARIETVTATGTQEMLPTELQYSVARKLLRVHVGNVEEKAA